MSERAPAFGDLGEFKPRERDKRPDRQMLDEVAESQGFPSRSPRKPEGEARPAKKARRFTTGRNQQINVKASNETIELFHSIADELGQPLGAVLELALEALAREQRVAGGE